VVHKAYDRARKAPLVAGPFGGVPFLLKDLLASDAGMPCSHGSRFFRNTVLDHDSELSRGRSAPAW